LVGGVRDTDIKEGEVNFDSVTADELKLVLVTHYVHTFGDLSDHAWVNFDCDDLFASLHKSCCQVTCAWTDF